MAASDKPKSTKESKPTGTESPAVTQPVDTATEKPALAAKPQTTPPAAATPSSAVDAKVEPAKTTTPSPAPTEGEPAAKPAASAATGGEPRKDTPAGAAAKTPTPPPSSANPRRGGLVAPVLGGVIAAVIGFALARYVVPEGWPFGPSADRVAALSTQNADQAKQIADLQTQLAQLSKTVSGVSGKLDTAQGMGDRLDALSSGVDQKLGSLKQTLEQQIAALPKGASGQAGATASGQDVASLASQLTAEQKQTAAMTEELKALSDKLSGQVSQNADAASALKTQMSSLSSQVAAEVALGRIRTALQIGGGYAPALATLKAEGVSVPAEIADPAQSGVETLAALNESFPAAARAALKKSLKADMGQGYLSRVSAFLRSQTGLRSLSPRAGDDPDAVLSRAQADLDAGKLDAALAEIAKLPQAGQDAMSDWLTKARARQAALNAAAALSADLGKK